MTNFVDDRHSFYVGWVHGLALKHGLPVKPVFDEAGNYTDRLVLVLDLARESHTVTIIVPPPPPDWSLLDAAEDLPVDVVITDNHTPEKP